MIHFIHDIVQGFCQMQSSSYEKWYVELFTGNKLGIIKKTRCLFSLYVIYSNEISSVSPIHGFVSIRRLNDSRVIFLIILYIEDVFCLSNVVYHIIFNANKVYTISHLFCCLLILVEYNNQRNVDFYLTAVLVMTTVIH